jgi:hypothetical protein
VDLPIYYKGILKKSQVVREKERFLKKERKNAKNFKKIEKRS